MRYPISLSRIMIPFLVRRLETLNQSSRLAKRAVVLSSDIVLVALSVWLAYFLRLGYWSLMYASLPEAVGLALLLFIPISMASGVYNAIFRYAGIGMFRTIARALVFYLIAMTFVFTVVTIDGVPRTIGLIQPLALGVMMIWSRITVRYLFLTLMGQHGYRGRIRRLLIYGAGAGGQSLAISIRHVPEFKIVGFVDDDARLDGQKLDGVHIYARAPIVDIIENQQVTDVLLAMPSASRSRRREIIDDLSHLEVNVLTLPSASEVVGGNISFSDIRPIEIEDLLGREQVVPHEFLLGRTIVGKTVLVTGAGGSIGSELCRQIREIGAKRLILLDSSEFALYSIDQELSGLEGSEVEIVPTLGSVTDRQLLQEIFVRERIETVFHAAAYKHVPLVQQNPIEAIQNNVMGTWYLAQIAREHNVADFILISTDKAVRPTNVMGATKRVAEQIIQSFADSSTNSRYSMVRFGNVLGSSGSVVPLFQSQIAKGGPVTLTHRDITRYFMTIPEAANLVIQAGGMASGGEVFVLDMGKPVKIFELARTMINLSGLSVRDRHNPAGDIEIVETGLRPGEKLHEELLIGENAVGTTHERIMKAHETQLEWPQLSTLLEELGSCRDDDCAIAILEAVVPEFVNRRDND